MDMLDKGVTQVPGGILWDNVRFHRAARTGEQFKTDELFISVIFRLKLWDRGSPWVTETTASETVG